MRFQDSISILQREQIEGHIYKKDCLLCNTSIVFCLPRKDIEEKVLTLEGAAEFHIFVIRALEIKG